MKSLWNAQVFVKMSFFGLSHIYQIDKYGKRVCGVPQGFILEPLFFLFYINGMPQAAKCELLLYAHDNCLVFQHNDVEEIEIQLHNLSLTCD